MARSDASAEEVGVTTTSAARTGAFSSGRGPVVVARRAVFGLLSFQDAVFDTIVRCVERSERVYAAIA